MTLGHAAPEENSQEVRKFGKDGLEKIFRPSVLPIVVKSLVAISSRYIDSVLVLSAHDPWSAALGRFDLYYR